MWKCGHVWVRSAAQCGEAADIIPNGLGWDAGRGGDGVVDRVGGLCMLCGGVVRATRVHA